MLTILGLQHVTAFQWTTTAAIAGAAGIFLFYTSNTEEKVLQVLEEGMAVLLILLSLAIRDDVFLMTLPLAGLCFWWKYGTLKRTNGTWNFRLRHWGVPAALVVGVAVLLGVEAFAYRSPEWKEFREYNVNREAIMDYYGLQDYEEDPAFFDSLGFTPEETENLHRYSLYLNDNLYNENMAKLAEHSKEVYAKEHPAQERILSGLEDIYEHLGKNTYHMTNVVCLCMIALALGYCAGKNRKQLGLALSVLVFWGAYWFYLGYRNRILERVGFALYLLAFLIMLAIWYRAAFLESRKDRYKDSGLETEQELACKWASRLQKTVLVTGVCAVLSLTAWMTWDTIEENNLQRSNYNLQFLDVNAYMAEHPENVYFMTTFTIETYTDNFTLRRDFAFSNLLSVGGWHTFSPLENVKNEKLGISEPRTDIVEQENVYVISLQNVNLRYMDRYYTSLYGDGYQGRELIDTLEYGEQIFEVYDFSAKEEAS